MISVRHNQAGIAAAALVALVAACSTGSTGTNVVQGDLSSADSSPDSAPSPDDSRFDADADPFVQPIPAGASCQALLDQHPSTPSGVYEIDPDGEGGEPPFRSYCEMVDDGGGWTLVAKLDGAKQTFAYDAALWLDDTLLGPDSPELDRHEAKLPGFLRLPLKEMRVGMIDDDQARWISFAAVGSSLVELLRRGDQAAAGLAIDAGREAWRSLLARPSLQLACNREGFGAWGDNRHGSHVRIGISANNEDDCATNDSWIGFGGVAEWCKFSNHATIGNVCCFGCEDGDRNHATFGYLMIR